MRILIAFDKFKDALSASEACAIASTALLARRPDWSITASVPLTDGGEGFCAILTSAGGGTVHTCTVTGPRGTPVEARFGLVSCSGLPVAAKRILAWPELSPDAPVGIIEMAQASGLALLAPEARDPWHTTTAGTGELIRAALDHGAQAVLLGAGGSATHDLGLGVLAALGVRALAADGSTVFPPAPVRWPEIVGFASAGRDTRRPIRVACDVINPLLGARGAATVFAPQKGLHAAELPALEAATARMAGLLCTHFGRPATLPQTPGAGAAGGLTFGLLCATDARVVPGYDLVAAWCELEQKLAEADLVITGEGRFDESSLEGKGPGALAQAALRLGKTVHVFAGQVAPLTPRPGLHLHAITRPGTPLSQALRNTAPALAEAVATVFSD